MPQSFRAIALVFTALAFAALPNHASAQTATANEAEPVELVVYSSTRAVMFMWVSVVTVLCCQGRGTPRFF